jgi:lysophospholipase-2
MMLAGFSQGGAMSLFTGLQLPAEEGEGGAQTAPALAGIVVMSGYLPGGCGAVYDKLCCCTLTM